MWFRNELSSLAEVSLYSKYQSLCSSLAVNTGGLIHYTVSRFIAILRDGCVTVSFVRNAWMHVGKPTTVVTLNKGLRCEGLRYCEAISKISHDTTTEVFRMHFVCRMLVAVHFTVVLLARVPSKCQKIKICRSVVVAVCLSSTPV